VEDYGSPGPWKAFCFPPVQECFTAARCPMQWLNVSWFAQLIAKQCYIGRTYQTKLIIEEMVESRLSALNAHFTPSQVTVTIKDRVALVEMTPPTKLIFLGGAIVEQLTQTM